MKSKRRSWTKAERARIGEAVKRAAALRKNAKPVKTVAQVRKSQKQSVLPPEEQTTSQLLTAFLRRLEAIKQEKEDETARLEHEIEELDELIEAINDTEIG